MKHTNYDGVGLGVGHTASEVGLVHGGVVGPLISHYRAAVNSTLVATFLDSTDYAVLTHAASVILVNMEVYTLALLVEGLLDASACSALAV